MIFAPFAFQNQVITSVGPPPFVGILDTYPTAQIAYSLRRLGPYNGSAIKVRRATDNAELNVGFDSSGSLDTAALAAFAGTGSAFIASMYDQSGNSVTASQATTTSQPRIVTNGTINTINSVPTMFFDSGDWLSGTLQDATNNYSSVFIVEKVANTTGNYVSFSQNNNAAGTGFGVINHSSGWWGDFNWAAGQEAQYTPNTTNYKVGAAIHQSGSVPENAVYVNGTIGGTTTSVTTATIGTNVNIGTIFNGTFNYTGSISEIIVWRGNQTTNVSGITNNMKLYYGIA